jgi:hypothetical protein
MITDYIIPNNNLSTQYNPINNPQYYPMNNPQYYPMNNLPYTPMNNPQYNPINNKKNDEINEKTIINKIDKIDDLYDYEIFLNCVIQFIFFIIMLIILIEFYFIDKIKRKLTNDIINNIEFYINNIDITKENLSNKYINIEKLKNFEYDKYIELINNNKILFEDINQNVDYVYLILSYILLLLIFIIFFFIFTYKISIKNLILLFIQNIFIFIIIGIFQYYFLDMIISKYSFIYNNNFSNNIIDVIKLHKLV